MARDFNISMQVTDGHLRLVSQGNLTDLAVRQLLRAAEAGLCVFPVVIVDLQGAREASAGAVTSLEEGLRQIIAQRKHALLKVESARPRPQYSLLKESAPGLAKT